MIIKERDSYLAVFDILLTVTLLSNNFNDELERDGARVIDFVANAFKLDERMLEECHRVIPDDLTMLSTIQDAEAFLSNRGYEEFPKQGNLLYLKAEAILKLNNIFNFYDNQHFNQQYFDYQYLRPYFASIRYRELESSSVKGNVLINRTVALMLALGIGCKQNIKSAIYRLKQCAYWGDISSSRYLSYLYELEKDEKNAKHFADLYTLEQLLLEGRTMIPPEMKNKYDEGAQKAFELIASIRQDIVLSFNQQEINYSFVEVMLMDSLDYYTKMQLVNRYNSQEWKEFTNSSSDPNKRLGFNKKG